MNPESFVLPIVAVLVVLGIVAALVARHRTRSGRTVMGRARTQDMSESQIAKDQQLQEQIFKQQLMNQQPPMGL